MKNLLRPFEDLLCLFFPHLCLACERNAPPYGEHICISCRTTLPEANFHFTKENPFTDRFWGRVDVQAGAALYLFAKESRVQSLIHNLKYNGKTEVGIVLGRRFGLMLHRSPLFSGVDVIVPVPLHVRKERIRGYNQSEIFGNGLSESMGKPCMGNGLKRIIHSESQTKQSREARLQNVSEVFTVGKPEALKGKHILLVDDVLTTGATLEVCANRLLEIPGTKVSMATIAIATH
ncbi:MAG: ComF family protein [Bacteroidetes bacterium]|nr:ComF family protein [Bacteroidota bacterium]